MKFAVASNTIFYQNKFEDGYLLIEGKQFSGFTKTRPENIPIVEAFNRFVLPGIIDVHNHGYMGWSVAAAKSRNDVSMFSKTLASAGVVGVLATSRNENALPIIADYINESCIEGSKILGIHAEGPYLHPEKIGASIYDERPDPSVEYTDKLLKLAKGHIKYTTVAPDLEGIDSSIRTFQKNNVVIAFGHTNARYAEMVEYIRDYSPAISTHTGNAMRGIDRRDGGTLGAVLLDPHMKCELIADLIHVSKEVIELFFRVKDVQDFVLVSDSGELAGAKPGKYLVRGTSERIVYEDGSVKLASGTHAGSSKDILYGIECLVNTLKIPLEKLVPSFSHNPAQLLGLNSKGKIYHGYDADFFICDYDFSCIATYVEGTCVYHHEDSPLPLNPELIRLD